MSPVPELNTGNIALVETTSGSCTGSTVLCSVSYKNIDKFCHQIYRNTFIKDPQDNGLDEEGHVGKDNINMVSKMMHENLRIYGISKHWWDVHGVSMVCTQKIIFNTLTYVTFKYAFICMDDAMLICS